MREDGWRKQNPKRPYPTLKRTRGCRADPYRLRMRAFASEEKGECPVLVLVIHGDAPFNEPDYQYVFAAKVAVSHHDVVAVGSR